MSWTAISVYAISFGVLVMAGFGLGPPEEVALPGAGIAAGVNPEVRWWILLPVCIAGVILADALLYGFGRFYGDRLLSHRWMARMMPPAKRQAIEKNFHEYGISILLIGRLVPGIRAPLFLTSGAIRLRMSHFLIADGLGAVLGNSLLFFLGYFLGDQFKEAIVRVESNLKPILIVIVLAAVVAYILYLFLRHPVTTGDPEEVPLIGHQIAEHMKSEQLFLPPSTEQTKANHAPGANGAGPDPAAPAASEPPATEQPKANHAPGADGAVPDPTMPPASERTEERG
jgi:membrane protein DedA with SNARE-associated domain